MKTRIYATPATKGLIAAPAWVSTTQSIFIYVSDRHIIWFVTLLEAYVPCTNVQGMWLVRPVYLSLKYSILFTEPHHYRRVDVIVVEDMWIIYSHDVFFSTEPRQEAHYYRLVAGHPAILACQ